MWIPKWKFNGLDLSCNGEYLNTLYPDLQYSVTLLCVGAETCPAPGAPSAGVRAGVRRQRVLYRPREGCTVGKHKGCSKFYTDLERDAMWRNTGIKQVLYWPREGCTVEKHRGCSKFYTDLREGCTVENTGDAASFILTSGIPLIHTIGRRSMHWGKLDMH